MHRRHKFDIIVILAGFAAGVSLYLAVSHYMGVAVPCQVTKGCELVLSSKYSSLFGVPLSVLGVAYFLGAMVAALLANHYVIWRKILSWYLGLGALMALVFLSLQFFVIKKVCQYCLTTDIVSIVIFLWDLNIEHRKD